MIAAINKPRWEDLKVLVGRGQWWSGSIWALIAAGAIGVLGLA